MDDLSVRVLLVQLRVDSSALMLAFGREKVTLLDSGGNRVWALWVYSLARMLGLLTGYCSE